MTATRRQFIAAGAAGIVLWRTALDAHARAAITARADGITRVLQRRVRLR